MIRIAELRLRRYYIVGVSDTRVSWSTPKSVEKLAPAVSRVCGATDILSAVSRARLALFQDQCAKRVRKIWK
jgi:hypothetical protein